MLLKIHPVLRPQKAERDQHFRFLQLNSKTILFCKQIQLRFLEMLSSFHQYIVSILDFLYCSVLHFLQNLSKKVPSFSMKSSFFAVFIFIFVSFCTTQAEAYPIFAQQNYPNPREANGRIVCANCHLAQKGVEIEVPQAVLPDTIFEAVIKIPYDKQITQVLGNGKKGGLNVGAVVILPSGFSLAPENRISEELKNKVGNVVYQPYSDDKSNILVVGPLPGKNYSEMVLPLLSPDPNKNKEISYLKYPIYLGANRGRGQVYPDGSKSNNTIYNSSVSGKIVNIEKVSKKGAVDITIEKANGEQIVEKIPAGPSLLVKEGQTLQADQPLTNNPNVGGFGQEETEIVLQSPARIQGLILFFIFVVLTQLFLVFKKKQFEKVQLAEMNF